MDVGTIKEVLRVCKRLDECHLVNAYEGNVSIRQGGYIYITPRRRKQSVSDGRVDLRHR